MAEDGIEVHPELRVPFEATPFMAEAWLRAERPGPRRLETLIAAQPEHMRPMLQRLLRDAAANIAGSDTTTTTAVEDSNHAQHLLAAPALADELPPAPATPSEELAEMRDDLVAAERMVEKRDREIEALRAQLAAAQATDRERVEDVDPGDTPLAESTALLDADPDDLELPEWDSSAPVGEPDAPGI